MKAMRLARLTCWTNSLSKIVHINQEQRNQKFIRTSADGEWVSGHPPRPEQDVTKEKIR
jgi:hypothetical protein